MENVHIELGREFSVLDYIMVDRKEFTELPTAWQGNNLLLIFSSTLRIIMALENMPKKIQPIFKNQGLIHLYVYTFVWLFAYLFVRLLVCSIYFKVTNFIFTKTDNNLIIESSVIEKYEEK